MIHSLKEILSKLTKSFNSKNKILTVLGKNVKFRQLRTENIEDKENTNFPQTSNVFNFSIEETINEVL